MKNRLLVTKQRPVHSYAELWHASYCVLNVGLNNPAGCAWQFLSSTVLTAFTFEAYLNHIGPRVLNDWEEKEKLPLWSKFKHLRKALDVQFPQGKGARPLKTIAELFSFRNTLAHGRSCELTSEEHISVIEFEKQHSDLVESQLHTDWETRIRTSAFAQLVRDDVEIVIRALHAARNDDDDILFNSGIGSHSATLDVT
jgi:hypothetical protein